MLFGGAIFAILAGVYYWFPKLTGRMYNEKMGQLHFWLMFIGQNVTFFPMHFTGLNGMPRRIYAYYSGMGWDFWNLVSTLGAFILAAGFVIFIYNMARSWRSGEQASADPWDGRTLEWSIPSPPPEYNFAEVPHVQDRDDWVGRRSSGGASAGRRPWSREDRTKKTLTDIHLPQPSYWPFFVSLGIFIVGFSLVYLINMNEAGIRTVNYVALTTAVIGVFIGLVSVYACRSSR